MVNYIVANLDHQILESLLSHISLFVPVSSELESRLTEISINQKVEKGEFLHRPERICKTTWYIKSGLLRVFYQKDDKEITDNFSGEGEWITSVYSFLKNIPDHFYIEAIEPSELIAINIDKLEQCFQDFPEMERFGRMLMSQYFLQQSERIISLQFHSAKERYHFFLKTSPNKVQRVPLGMLASHLGMTQETLSRVRADRTAC